MRKKIMFTKESYNFNYFIVAEVLNEKTRRILFLRNQNVINFQAV